MTGLLSRVWRLWRLLCDAVLNGRCWNISCLVPLMQESCLEKKNLLVYPHNLQKHIDNAIFLLAISCLYLFIRSFEGFCFAFCYFHMLAVDTFVSLCILHWTRGSFSPLQIVFGSHQCVTCSQDWRVFPGFERAWTVTLGWWIFHEIRPMKWTLPSSLIRKAFTVHFIAVGMLTYLLLIRNANCSYQ